MREPTAVTEWTFGEQPLGQTKRATSLIRDFIGDLLALEREDAAVDDLIAAMRERREALRKRDSSGLIPRVGPDADGPGRVYLDHSRNIGSFNAGFPTYEIQSAKDHATGSVCFPINYEGPPGIVHGGFVALFFDSVVQHHNCDRGSAGKTVSLAVRYHRPTPVLKPLAFTIDRHVDGGRINSKGRLLEGGTLLCASELVAVASEQAQLPRVGRRRGGE